MSVPDLEDIRSSTPSASQIVLWFLNIPEFEICSVSVLVRVASGFGIDEPAVRVAIGRLVKRGLVNSVSRGVYSIGPKGKALRATARDWKSSEERRKPWDGSWIVVHTAHLGRTNKTALRARERAFRLRGFGCLVKDVWVRPSNLRESLAETRNYLVTLGLEEDALVTLVAEVSGTPAHTISGLWNVEKLENGYKKLVQHLNRSIEQVPDLSAENQARDFLLLGNEAIRQINIDPLLPDELIDTSLRKKLVERTLDYNEIGISFWHDYVT